MVGLAAVVVVVRIADEVAARWVVAVDEDGVVVVNQALQLAVDPVVAVAWLFPPEGFISDDHVAGEQFLAQFFHRGAAEVGADAGTVGVAVAVVGKGRRIDGGAQGIVDHVWRTDKAPLWVGGGEWQVVEVGGHRDILCIAEGFKPHEGADGFAANPGIDAVDLADVGHVADLVGAGCLGEDAVGIGPVGADGFVEGEFAVAVDAVKLTGDVVHARGEGVVGEVDAAPGFTAAAVGLFVGDGGFGNGDSGPVGVGDVGVEAEAHEFLSLCAVAAARGDAVDDGAGFGAGEAVFRAEGAVFITADPAKAGGDGDLLGSPVVRRHVAEGGGGAGFWRQAHEQVDHFRTGDGVVWPEGGAVVKEAEAAEGAHIGGEPVSVVDVGVGAGAGAAFWIFEQAVNDGGGFSAGDLAFRAHAAVFITAEVAHVVFGERHGYGAVGRVGLWGVRRFFWLGKVGIVRQRGVGVAGIGDDGAAGGVAGVVGSEGWPCCQCQRQTERRDACGQAFVSGCHSGSLLCHYLLILL